MSDPRDMLLARLADDLIGGESPEPELREKPSDRYLTGILFPQRQPTTPEDDDSLGNSDGDGESTDDGAAEEVPMAGLQKPAAAGISFCLEAGADATILIRVTGGTYRRHVQDEAGAAEPPAGGTGGASADSTSENATEAAAGEKPKGPRVRWVRTGHDFTVPLTAPVSGSDDKELDEHGLPGFRLHLTASAAPVGRLVTVVLVNGNEVRKGDGPRPDELALFQAHLEIRPGPGTRFPARPATRVEGDEDAQSAALLFRDAREFAVGHTCSARWETADGVHATLVATTWMPRHDVSIVSADGGRHLQDAIKARSGDRHPLDSCRLMEASTDFDAALGWLPDAYEQWVTERESEIEALEASLQPQARTHVHACREALRRMRRGLALLMEQQDVRVAFALMNRAMQLQRRWITQKDDAFEWRPFQIGFILHSIESIADPSVPERNVMDLLWFPTGGGKTEAYLGLIAFTLLLRRLRGAEREDRGGGTCCIMRYTLRLLTLQQFQRAATLILACELLRRRPPGDAMALKGAAPVSIGLWVGGSATPNRFKEAVEALASPTSPTTPKQISNCPCCRAPLDWVAEEAGERIRVSCSNAECELRRVVGDLPVLTVDDLIYGDPPTLLFATVDKFAQIVRSEAATAIFNADTAPPPELIIQDELHLISGPLGTLSAVYECAVDRICSRDGIPPKIIGSTATIRRAGEQIRALFDRAVAQFPPPGLSAEDSCFAALPQRPRTRRYLGISTAGRSAKFTLQAVYASLMQAEHLISDAKQRDGYHTLVGYFNSLRELGGALVLAQDDVPATIRLLARRRQEQERDGRAIVELTSRVSQSEIRDLLDRLELAFTEDDSVDVLLATNMISVGVDVGRLALMVVFGQPKGIAEYIQATSRVGRTANEGLVITVFNNAKARDRSHFETFSAWHAALYRGVEATSVTPFASRSRDRALHAAVVALARHLVPGLRSSPVLGPEEEAELEPLIEELAERAARIDPQEAKRTRRELKELVAAWRERSEVADAYWNDFKPKTTLLMSAEQAVARLGARRGAAFAWPTLNSMRNVEAATPFRLVERLSNGPATDDDE